ncbi:HD-GYP domain-containing protein, partial [Christensenellaceae bacterium OttesenSCG-928-M15]|nr:HD-GYP domain-containing protein [Christensenellaceae bacterium OttesenSCG-928-M15]
LGYDYIKKWFSDSISPLTSIGVLDHHERLDGSGYPNGKRGDKISEFGKLIAVADVYDALISDRPYRKGVFPVEAMEYVQGGCGAQFEFAIVEAFSRKIALFPVGTCVLLSDGSTALVMENFEGLTQRPNVKVFMMGEYEVEPFYLNLSREALDITIVATVDM